MHFYSRFFEDDHTASHQVLRQTGGLMGEKKRNRLLLFQSSEGREYLLSLEHVAAWVAERVLPFLVKRPKEGVDEEEQEKSCSLAAQITEVSSHDSEKTVTGEDFYWKTSTKSNKCVLGTV